MKRFKCKVERTDEYIIEFDENIWNEEMMTAFREVFFNFHSLEEHAEQVAQMRARFGNDFIEGYGIPRVNGKLPWCVKEDDKNAQNSGVNIIIESEDEDVCVDIREID